ncbi:hypothetical protein ACI45T_004765, partial [Vibrio vulnificus]
HPEFIVDLIWKVLDKTAKIDPEGFRQANYTAAFSVDIATVINYGLQTEFPCYDPIPKSLQFNGWKY